MTDVEHDVGSVDFYWGLSAGGTHAALRRARDDEEIPSPEYCMVSYTTAMNGLWPGPEWMIDCGGSPVSIRTHGGHPADIDDYVEYLVDPPRKYARHGRGPLDIGTYALRDWPCEPAVRDALGISVVECQQRTLEDHIATLEAAEDAYVDAQPMAVLQGWDVEDYLVCIDRFREHGLITDTMALGTVCRRTTSEAVAEVREIAQRVRRNLPARVDLHGFGLKKTLLEDADALGIFDSVDSTAWDMWLNEAQRGGVSSGPPQSELDDDDWIDYDDDGDPRYTWKNIQLCYEGYRERLTELEIDDLDVVDDEADWLAFAEGLDGIAEDGYLQLACEDCETLLDPGRPDPLPDPGCETCAEYASVLRFWHESAHAEVMADG